MERGLLGLGSFGGGAGSPSSFDWRSDNLLFLRGGSLLLCGSLLLGGSLGLGSGLGLLAGYGSDL